MTCSCVFSEVTVVWRWWGGAVFSWG